MKANDTSSLRYGIVSRELTQAHHGGTYRIVASLLETANRFAEHDSSISFSFIHNSPQHCGQFPRLRETFVNVRNKWLFDFLYVPLWARRERLDAVFFPKNVIPFGVRGARYVLMLDLGYFFPRLGAYQPLDRMLMTTAMRLSVRRADHVFAISEHTRGAVINLLGVQKSHVSTMHLAASKEYQRIEDPVRITNFRARHGLPEQFLLFTGGITPRKNLVRSIAAFQAIAHQIKDLYFVITGSMGWSNDEVLDLIERTPQVMRIGYVEDEDMPTLYSMASVYIYPSLYEGFGLPILEAQACGCPVVTSNISSCPEVAGAGAMIVDPYSIEAISTGIARILSDDHYRAKLVENGYQNLERFSWDKALKLITNRASLLNHASGTASGLS